MRRLLTILRSFFLPTPEWEQIEAIERELAQLRAENRELRGALQEFCTRVERGEIQSKCTYGRFKQLLTS